MPQNETSVTDDDDVILSRFQTNPFLLSSVLLTGPLASQLSRAFHHRLQSIREVLECHIVSLAVLGGDALQASRESDVSFRSSLLEKPPLERNTTTVQTDLDGNEEEEEHGDAMQTFCVALGVSVGHASTFRGGPAIAARLSKQHEARRVLQKAFSVPLDICGDGVQWLLVEAAPPTATTAAATALDSSTSSSAAMPTASPTSSTTLRELLYGCATYASHGSSSSENGASLLISNLRLAAKQLEELLAAYVRWTPLSAPPPILLRSPSLLPQATQKSESGSVGASGYHLLFLGSDHHSNKPSSFATEVLVVPTNMDYIAAGSLFQSQIPHRFELRMPHCLRRLIRSLSTVVPSDDADDGGEQSTPLTRTTTATELTSSCPPHKTSYLVTPSVRDDVQSACHIQTKESSAHFRGFIHLWGGSGGAVVASVTGTVPQLSPQLYVQVASGLTADECCCLLGAHPADDVWALGALYLDVLVQCVVSVPNGNRFSEGDDKSSDLPRPSEAAAVVCLSDYRAVHQLIQSLTHELQRKQRPTTEPQQEETAPAVEWHTVLAKQMTAAAGWKFPADLLQRIVDWLHPDPKERWRLFAEAQGLSPSFGPSHDDIDLPALRLVSSSQSSARVGPRQDGEFIATVNSPSVFSIKQRYARWKLRVEKQISSETAGVNALETRSATMFHRLLQLLWEAREALRHRVDKVHPASARSGGHPWKVQQQQQLDDFLHRLLASPQLSSIAEVEQLNIRQAVKMMFHHPTARLPAVLLERLLRSEFGAATGDGWIFGDAIASSNNGVGLIPSALDVFTGGSGRKSSSAVSTNPTGSSNSKWTPIDSSSPSSDSISWCLTEQQRANRRLQQKLGPLRSAWPLWPLELTPMVQLVYVDTLRSLLLECGADDAASFVGRGRVIAQLRSLVQRFGMPPTLRFDMWMALLSSASLCSSSDTSSPPAAASTVRRDDHNDRNATEKPTTNDRQIAVDIPRCHQYVERLASLDGHIRIRQAVKEWLVLHPSYVYWQGIDSVCAVLLSTRFEQPERLTTLLDRLMETLVPHFFANPSVQGTIQHRLVGMYLLLRYYDPELALHLEAVDCKCELFTISWFLTLFAHVLPLEKIYLVWDFLIVQSSGTTTRDATGTSPLPSGTSAGPAVCIATAVVLLSPARSKLLQSDFSQCIGILSGPSLWETVQVDNVLRLAGTFLSAAPPSVIFPNLDCAVGSLIKTSCCALVDAAEIAAACLSNHAGGEEEDSALPCESIEVLEKLLMKSFAASTAIPPHGAASSKTFILGSPQLLLQGGDAEHWTDGGVLLVDTRTLEEQRRRPPSSKSVPLRRRRREEKAIGDSTTTSDDDDDEVEGGIAVSGGPHRRSTSSRRSIVLGSVHHPYDGETGWNVDAVMKDLCERDLYLIPPRSSSFVLENESDAKGASQVHPNDVDEASAMTKKQESYFDMFAAGVRSAPTVVLLAGMEPENGQQAAESLMRMGVAKVGMVLGGVNRLRAVAPELFLEIEEKLS